MNNSEVLWGTVTKFIIFGGEYIYKMHDNQRENLNPAGMYRVSPNSTPKYN